MIDTHAHLHDKIFEEDRAAVLERARARGVESILTVGCDLEDSARALECARTFGLRASVGIHPHEAKEAPHDLEAAFAPFLADEHVIAIGETGLDYYYDHSPRDIQMECLRQQIRLARAHEYPVIFHHRDAFDDFERILREEFTAEMRGVVHCFTGDTRQAQVYTQEFGLKLGIGGVMTFRTAQTIRDALIAVGPQACILETDCPYLAPIPHRGKRNEPAFVADTAQALATLCSVPIEEIAAITNQNARALFTFP